MKGLRTKLHVMGDNHHQLGLEWGQISGTVEMPKLPPAQEAVICPRCGSTKTKFCYYNNYNKSQPRHFCKSCKRHWTKGGTLRNVGRRNNKRRKTLTAAAAEPPPRQHCRNIPCTTNNSTGLNTSLAISQGSNACQLPLSNLGNTTLDVNVNGAMINPTSYYQSLNDHIIDNYFYYPGNLNLDYAKEESTITSVDVPASGEMELSNDWNYWDEIDVDLAWEDV